MAEVHIQTFAVCEIRICAATMEDDLRHTLLYDLKILRPRGQRIRERGGKKNQCFVLSFWEYGTIDEYKMRKIVKLTLNPLTVAILSYTSY